MADVADWTPPASAADITALSGKLDQVIANTGLLTGTLADSDHAVTTIPAQIYGSVSPEGVIITNLDTAVTVWIGGPLVTAGHGTPVPPNSSRSFGTNGSALWAVSDSGTVTVHLTYGSIG